MVGYLVTSKAGHDKDKLYVVLKEEGEYVWLTDGKNRTILNPKKKNKKHVQIIKVFTDENIRTSLRNSQDVPDHVLSKFIREYSKHQSME